MSGKSPHPPSADGFLHVGYGKQDATEMALRGGSMKWDLNDVVVLRVSDRVRYRADKALCLLVCRKKVRIDLEDVITFPRTGIKSLAAFSRNGPHC